MNFDELTIGQAKEIKAMLGGEVRAPLERKRVILVVDRGWIFAGDQTATADGYVRLSRAVHVFRWESVGFAQMIKDVESDSSKHDIRKCDDVEVPRGSVIFRVPVSGEWGL